MGYKKRKSIWLWCQKHSHSLVSDKKGHVTLRKRTVIQALQLATFACACILSVSWFSTFRHIRKKKHRRHSCRDGIDMFSSLTIWDRSLEEGKESRSLEAKEVECDGLILHTRSPEVPLKVDGSRNWGTLFKVTKVTKGKVQHDMRVKSWESWGFQVTG